MSPIVIEAQHLEEALSLERFSRYRGHRVPRACGDEPINSVSNDLLLSRSPGMWG
jgi:hypothetical protein